MVSKQVEVTQKTIPKAPSFSLLPDEIIENILARVSRWNYPWLSLVSKSFRSLLSSMDIYKTRSQIGANELCVYVYLEQLKNPSPSWFRLWLKPNKIQTKQNSSGNVVVPIRFTNSSNYPLIPSKYSLIAVGLDIYMIGAPTFNDESTSVRILDCRNHTWREAPNMTVPRSNACAVLLDGKIYVMDGCGVDDYPTNWIEVFDINTQSWTSLPRPSDEELRDQLQRQYCVIVNVVEGKIHVAAEEKDYSYDPKDHTWKVINEESSFVSVNGWCKIENRVYCYTCDGYLMWSDDPEVREWREIKGLEKLSEHRTRGFKIGGGVYIGDYGGKLLVMWDSYPKCIKRGTNIWYAIISLELRCNGREVWGNVECVDVLTFPVESFEEFHCFIASV